MVGNTGKEQLEAIIKQQKIQTSQKNGHSISNLYPNMADHRQIVLELIGYLLFGSEEEKHFAKEGLQSHYTNIKTIEAHPQKIVVTSKISKSRPTAYEAHFDTGFQDEQALFVRDNAQQIDYTTASGKKNLAKLMEMRKKYEHNNPWSGKFQRLQSKKGCLVFQH